MHIIDLACIKTTHIKRGKRFTPGEHKSHLIDIARIETGYIYAFQVSAIFEHSVQIVYLVCYKAVGKLDILSTGSFKHTSDYLDIAGISLAQVDVLGIKQITEQILTVFRKYSRFISHYVYRMCIVDVLRSVFIELLPVDKSTKSESIGLRVIVAAFLAEISGSAGHINAGVAAVNYAWIKCSTVSAHNGSTACEHSPVGLKSVVVDPVVADSYPFKSKAVPEHISCIGQTACIEAAEVYYFEL